jgi:molybdate transport system substrate-binding protein
MYSRDKFTGRVPAQGNKLFATIVALCAFAVIATPVAARDILVFAAASTANALNAVLGQYTEKTGVTVRTSYASSGALARQIDHGAPAALFISANVAWVAWLDEHRRLASKTRVPLFGNRLVLVEPLSNSFEGPKGPKNAIPPKYLRNHDIRSRMLAQNLQKIAIPDPAHVPAGAYAKEALTSMNLWKTVSAKAVWTRDVRAALLLVERREVALGIVYKSDAKLSSKTSIINTFSSDAHRSIRYHMAIVKEQDGSAARRLFAYLQSLPSKATFARFGFDTMKYYGPAEPR